MNKLLIALGLPAAVVLVGCSKEKAPETGATTGEHLENAAEQAGHDINKAASEAVSDTQKAADEASEGVGSGCIDHRLPGQRASCGRWGYELVSGISRQWNESFRKKADCHAMQR